MKKLLLLAFALLATFGVWAQQKQLTAKIDSVAQSGYYHIRLDPQITGACAESFYNLRLIDVQGQEIPYFVRSQQPVKESSSFLPYPTISNQLGDSVATLVVGNPNAQPISRLCVIINNVRTDLRLRLRGSNNLGQWYIVKKQEEVLLNTFKYSEVETMLIVDFPQGNYRYYEISLTNSQPSPVQIIKAGRINDSNIYAELAQIDLGNWLQSDSTNKMTYVRFPNLPYQCRIDKLEIEVEQQSEYYRQGKIFDPCRYIATTFTLSSSQAVNRFLLHNLLFDKDSRLEIQNNDNPPLRLKAIRAFARVNYVCAYLENGKLYSLRVEEEAGNTAPNYDITRFQEKIPFDLPILGTSESHVQVSLPPAPRPLAWYELPLFLWGVIGGVGLLLTLLCVAMIVQMRKEKS